MSAVPSGLVPVVGLSEVLRKEDMTMRSIVKNGQLSQIHFPAMHSPKHKKQHIDQGPAVRDRKSDRSLSPQAERKATSLELCRQKGPENDQDEDFESESRGKVSSKIEGALLKDAKKQKPEVEHQMHPKAICSDAIPESQVQQNQPLDSSIAATQHNVVLSPQSHHFSFSIDLRSVRTIHGNTTQNVFLRYTYPFFGSAVAIVTHPPIEICNGMEVLLPRSFCVFEFACSIQQLRDTFRRVPLIVEVCTRDKQPSADVLLGFARLSFADVIVTEKAENGTGKGGWKKVYSNKMPVISTDVHRKRIGEISFVLSLEDWGPLKTQHLLVSTQSSGIHRVTESSHSEAPVVEPKETEELHKAAMELEMWVEEQKHAFGNQLKQKEMMHMKDLAEEWKKLDRERELLIKKKLTKYAKMEEQLRKTLAELEKREKLLASNEQEVMHLKDDLHREHDRKLHEMKEASQRMLDDCDAKVKIEKTKCKGFEKLMHRCKDESNEAEKRRAKVEEEFVVFKDESKMNPEVRWQSEIHLLTMEKVELERKLDAQLLSRTQYKQQWKRVLTELARLRQKEQAQAKVHLMKQLQELEHMRMLSLAEDENEVVDNDQELEDIKNSLNKFNQIEHEGIKSINYSLQGSGKGDPNHGIH